MSELSWFWEHLSGFWSFKLLQLSGNQVTAGSVLTTVVLIGLAFYLVPRLKRWFMRKVLVKSGLETRTKIEALAIFKYLLMLIGGFIVLKALGLAEVVYEQLTLLQRQLSAVFDLKLFTLGKTSLTLWTTIYLVVLSWLLVRVTGQIEKLFLERLQTKTKIDRGLSETLATILRYAMLFIGMMVIIQSAGIDLSALTIVAGAAGLALGLGLQGIINNLVSGLVILFERPIKVGDRIDVGGTTGDVAHVSLRATTIVTNDDIAIIVPNSEFITNKVINWTYTGKRCRFKFPIRVAYGSDPALVKELLLEAATEHAGVLDKPAPSVNFDEFGESSLNFSLAVWTSDHITRPGTLRSDLNFAITEKFMKNKVQLPAPVDEDVEFPTVTDTPAQEEFAPKQHLDSSQQLPS